MKFIPTAAFAAVLLAALPACQGFPGGAIRRVKVAQTAPDLAQASQAWRTLKSEPPRCAAARNALVTYNQAVVAVVNALRKTEGTDAWGKPLQFGGIRPWRVSFDTQAPKGSGRTFTLRDFAKCELAADVKLTGFDQVVARDGLGVPVVLGEDDAKRVAQPFHPPDGEFLPATAVLEFSDAGARLRFYNPLEVSTVSVGPHSQRLSQDLTASLQRSLTNAIADDARPRMPTPSASGEVESQLFFLNRYDPSKTPVVFVHGLLCGPDVWKNPVNAMLADPDLRRRYQPVCFMYPSKLPIPATAARLRELLNRSREKLDPGHRNAGFDHIVLVGHSMGGLVSRMQVIDSGSDFWRAFFVVPPRKIARHVDANTARQLRGGLFFKPDPKVKLVVFISTPHRGSELADVGIFRAALRLVLFLPKTARNSLAQVANLPPDFFQPVLGEFHEWGAEGTENLSTRHPFFDALARHRPQVPFYSIIATQGEEDYRHGGDGIVPYSSAHLKGAVLETTVPYTHGCLERPETVQAVMKALKDNR